jgi:hypothetical protein
MDLVTILVPIQLYLQRSAFQIRLCQRLWVDRTLGDTIQSMH